MAAEGISRANTRSALVVPQLKSFGISDRGSATGMSYSEARGRAVVLLQAMLYCSCDWNGVSVFKEIGKGSGIASWTDQSAVECSSQFVPNEWHSSPPLASCTTPDSHPWPIPPSLHPPPLLLASEGIPFTSKPAVCLLGTVKLKPLSYQSGVLGSRSGPVTWNTQLLWATNAMSWQRAPHQLNWNL